MTSSLLYDRDFYAWANDQASLLREGRLSEADIEHIAEEIQSMGRSEKRELISRLTILLLHLLKWQIQPSPRGVSWRGSIDNARDDIGDLLNDNPSLKSLLDEAMNAAYRRARRQAAGETGLPPAVFPLASPWPLAMDPDYWPKAT